MEKSKPPKLSRKYKPKYGDEQNLLYPRRRCKTLVEESPKNRHVYQFVALKSMGYFLNQQLSEELDISHIYSRTFCFSKEGLPKRCCIVLKG